MYYKVEDISINMVKVSWICDDYYRCIYLRLVYGKRMTSKVGEVNILIDYVDAIPTHIVESIFELITHWWNYS